ncbi:Cation transport protein [Musa troglodytarum]|uniref:Cation transport protein n=1 Tax=Musa troglodytarum TaxID=320322 RepID=A0A9E7JZZ5_9LILI|nr:Cation transport protein [Musa troglodytarum]
MEAPHAIIKKARRIQAHVSKKLSPLAKRIWRLLNQSYEFILFRSDPFLVQLCYLIAISCAGFVALKSLRPKDEANRAEDLDLLFMAISASTVSSMATMEMEDFSHPQLWVLVILMLFGGEVFTSMVGLPFTWARLNRESERTDAAVCIDVDDEATDTEQLKHDAVRYLGYVVLGYTMIIHFSSFVLISLYLSLVSDARDVLKRKGFGVLFFSIFLSVSSFANCGFTPTDENMINFKKNSALLLLVIPLVLSGNTLFPSCLRSVVWLLQKLTGKEEFSYVLQHPEAIRYGHLFPRTRCIYLAFTVAVFTLVQLLLLLCSQEWSSEIFDGMSSYQRAVAALFQSVNSRHAGESVVDVSKLSPAILVVYVVMMYLPPYTCFVPGEGDAWPGTDTKGRRRRFWWSLHLSLLCYPVIFIILVCITERKSLAADPVNFNVFNVGFEVISAYANVGFSVGYSCSRLLKPESRCRDASYGFAGRWSNKGKLITVAVMLLGRLKKFQMEGGKAWKFG